MCNVNRLFAKNSKAVISETLRPAVARGWWTLEVTVVVLFALELIAKLNQNASVILVLWNTR